MNNTLLKKSEYSLFSTFICLVCFITNLSQMPFLVESALTRIVAIPVWLLLAGVCFLKDQRVRLGDTLPVWCVTVAFLLFYIFAMFFNETYKQSHLPYPIFLSMFIFAIGLMAGRHLDSKDISRIGSFYLASGIIVTVNVYFTYIYGQSLEGPSYLYASKNSVSQIILTTWILVLLQKMDKKGVVRTIFWFAALLFLSWTLISLKSRGTLISVPLVMLWILLNGKLNKRVRVAVLILILLLTALLVFSSSFYDTLINQVLLKGSASADVNAVTSGRSTEWQNFPEDFSEVWLFGAGRMKRESLILTALLEFGIFGGSMIFYLALSPLLWCFRNLRRRNPHFLLFTSVIVAYLINSIFEQIAPFGPGVKCYFLWLLFGLMESVDFKNTVKSKESKRNEEE